MASKKTQINNPLFGTSEVDSTMDSSSSSSSDASYAGAMTRRRTKALAKVYALTTSIVTTQGKALTTSTLYLKRASHN